MIYMYILVFCCSSSQHEAYEEPGQTNGLYALHLLRHIRRDERIEFILMDVARGTMLFLAVKCKIVLSPSLSGASRPKHHGS